MNERFPESSTTLLPEGGHQSVVQINNQVIAKCLTPLWRPDHTILETFTKLGNTEKEVTTIPTGMTQPLELPK